MLLDETLTALADPTRRAILARLAEGEARVTEVAAPFPISLNSVSKHIRVLERSGLVRRRVAGRDHFLTLNPAPLDEAAAWIEQQRRLWAWRLSELEKILKEQGDG
jgi:DNA-binding transcriptional ArsR family regulator